MAIYIGDRGIYRAEIGATEKTLPAGIYVAKFDWQQNMTLNELKFPSDEPLSLPGLPIDFVRRQAKEFFDSAEKYAKHNFIHKRGFLFYGPPGCGKTTLTKILCNYVTQELNGIVTIITSFENSLKMVSAIRAIEPDRPLLTLIEDIDSVLNKDRAVQEQLALSFLDGQEQTTHVINVATTNNPETIEDRFIKRPGRFDLVIGVHNPTQETREAYLKHICNGALSEERLRDLVHRTEGLGLSYLKEIAASHLCLGVPLDDQIERLKKQHAAKYRSGKQGYSIGYQSENNS